MYRTVGRAWVLFLGVCLVACTKEPSPWEASEEQRWMSGGSQTVFDAGAGAFSHAFPDMDGAAIELHGIGDGQFEQTFVSAPAPLNPGLGPVFNSVSCASCHVADGRGKPPAPGEQLLSMLFRISVPGSDPHGGPLGIPGYGGQLQQRAVFGAMPEANVSTTWSESPVTLSDGTTVILREPAYAVVSPYTNWPGDAMMSARVAPPVFGLGLLEAISAQDIRSHADEFDADGDGISGKANQVWDAQRGIMALGRFGWKAEQPSLLQQSAGAYVEDMGVTSPLFPQESCTGQPQYDGYADDSEITDSILHAVAFYVRTLGVPARRQVENDRVALGEQVFRSVGCAKCHTPEQRTEVNVAFAPLSNQRIFPYTDMLLHDMGTALSDNRPSYAAEGYEWRTPPLWGIGLTQVVNGHQNFLHDGRARSLLEAIMWHGGEGTRSRDAVRDLPTHEREALIAFLNSL